MTKKMRDFKERCKTNQKIFDAFDKRNEQIDEMEKCVSFIEKLADILKDKYEMMGSCNRDLSRYLVPIGTQGLVTYYGKPELSFRVSDHWNWYSNTKKCANYDYVQCNSVDIPEAHKRIDNKATKGIRGCQVAIQGTDGYYHHVYGEKYNRDTRKWAWVENDPTDICKLYNLI